MTDITTRLERAGRVDGWSAARYAEELRQRIGAELDWDRDSGEMWARLLRSREVLALIRANLALVLVRRDLAEQAAAVDLPAEVVPVAAFDEVCFEADADLLARLFPITPRSPGFDPAAFSAFDLWYASTTT